MTDRSAYGGQAVLEGVMIRGREHVATACRLKDGTIAVNRDMADTITRRYKWLRLAFLRGTPALIDSFRLGYRTLMWSSDQAMGAEEQKKPSGLTYTLTILVSMAFGIGLFVLLPTLLLSLVFRHAEHQAHTVDLLHQLIPSWSTILPNFTEGVLRVLILIGYITLIGFSKEIKRFFSYHGAEHKVVNAWEAGAELTVESTRGYSRIHPRCGTSFIFLVFIVGILLHSLFGWQVAWLRVVVRLVLLPVIAGVAYELIRLAGRYRKAILLQVLVWPGLLLQRLTTAEPVDDQIEVALCALRTVLEDEGVLAPAAPVTSTPTTASA